MKKIKLIFIATLLVLVISIANNSTAMTYYQTVDTSTGIVTASALNVRQGPRNKF